MANWTRLESPNFSGNEDTYETEIDNVCSDEPIDLKQVNCEPNQNQEDASSDWETSKLVKTKTFRIKDILGLEENDKNAVTSISSNLDSNFTYHSQYILDHSIEYNKYVLFWAKYLCHFLFDPGKIVTEINLFFS